MIRESWFDTLLAAMLACEVSAETKDEKEFMSMLACVLHENITIEGEKNEKR